MKCMDFEFAGRTLSSFGMIVCKFDSGGLDTVDNGSRLSFNTVATLGGQRHKLTSVQYEDCLESVIQICKYSCTTDIQEITPVEFRELTKWLNRKTFLKFKPLSEEYIDLYYEAKIDVSRIELDGKLYGLELTITTNTPFALKESKTFIINNKVKDGKHSINDTSYDEGYIYPYTEITIGDLTDVPEKERNLNIYNALEDRNIYVANVSTGEVITMNYPIIQSSISSHKIQNDFNWNFFRIANTYDNSRNDLTISIPCTMKIKYSPIVKVGL